MQLRNFIIMNKLLKAYRDLQYVHNLNFDPYMISRIFLCSTNMCAQRARFYSKTTTSSYYRLSFSKKYVCEVVLRCLSSGFYVLLACTAQLIFPKQCTVFTSFSQPLSQPKMLWLQCSVLRVQLKGKKELPTRKYITTHKCQNGKSSQC